MSTIERPTIDQITIRRRLKQNDGLAIGELHRRVYMSEHGLNDRFTESVDDDVARAIASGWPECSGGVWLVDRGGPLLGALALTDEGDGLGRVRWFALDPSLRGQGLGRSLFDELLAQARAQNLVEAVPGDNQAADRRRADLHVQRLPRRVGARAHRLGPAGRLPGV